MKLSSFVARAPRRVRAILVAAPALVAVACGSIVFDHAAGQELAPPVAVDVGGAGVERLANPATTAAAARPVPSVAPGTCESAVYTPPTASTARSGEICVPTEPTGEVVILLHGGGGFSGAPGDMDIWRDVHLAAGRTTFAIEYALVSDTLDEALWPLPEQNVKAAVQYLRRDATLAPRGIVLHGLSAGARLAGIVATTAGDATFAGDELWPGTSDAVDGAILFYGYYGGFQFYADAYYGATVPPGADVVAAVDETDAPMLVVHGIADGLIPVAESMDLAAAVQEAGGDAALLVVDGDHAFDHVNADGTIIGLTAAGRGVLDEIDGFVSGLAAS